MSFIHRTIRDRYLVNGELVTRLPRVYYHDFNNPKLSTLVSEKNAPLIGEQVWLRDFTSEFETLCVVKSLRRTSGTDNIWFVELDRIAAMVEYLKEDI